MPTMNCARKGVNISNFLQGGGQEGGRRAGTENVLLIAGLGAAAKVAREQGQAIRRHMSAMRDKLQQHLIAALPKVCGFTKGRRGSRAHGLSTLSPTVHSIRTMSTASMVPLVDDLFRLCLFCFSELHEAVCLRAHLRSSARQGIPLLCLFCHCRNAWSSPRVSLDHS
jgi:hypothetical protein